MDELQAGVELSLAVLPQPPVLLQPGKATLRHPELGDHREFVQFTALGNLHRDGLAQHLLHALRESLAHITAVGQHALNLAQIRLAMAHRL